MADLMSRGKNIRRRRWANRDVHIIPTHKRMGDMVCRVGVLRRVGRGDGIGEELAAVRCPPGHAVRQGSSGEKANVSLPNLHPPALPYATSIIIHLLILPEAARTIKRDPPFPSAGHAVLIIPPC
jgi:hypothetical protein